MIILIYNIHIINQTMLWKKDKNIELIYNKYLTENKQLNIVIERVKQLLLNVKNDPVLFSKAIDTYLVPHEIEKKINAEVSTPHFLRQQMLDKIPADFWSDVGIDFYSDKPIYPTVFEPCCGKGGFVVDIVNKLMVGLKAEIEDEEERYRVIVEECLYVADINVGWKKFKKKFKLIKSGGGLVLNQKKEILFIYRAKKWDLPKGKIEKGEKIRDAAIREVEEECGISDLKIIKPLLKTYHIFYSEKEQRLKQTHWYLMHSTYKGKLKPQLEEGITKVEFKNEAETQLALQNTYANIRLVLESFKAL